MNRILRVPAAFLALMFGMLLLASPIRAQAPSSDLTAVSEVAERLRMVMLKPDAAALGSIFADQLSYGHSDGRVQTKAEFTDALVSGKSVFHSITLTDQTISVVGDVAIVRHRFAADAVSNGKPSQPKIAILQVWQKQGDAWRLLVRQAH